MNDLTKAQKLPNGIMPLLTKSLPQHELDEHRANICVVMEMLVRKYDKFGWDQMNAGMRKMIREDWLASLADYPVDEVRDAGRQHTIEMPNKVPNEGHIYAIIMRNRAKMVKAAPPPTPEPERGTPATKAEAADIMAEVLGDSCIVVKRFGQ